MEGMDFGADRSEEHCKEDSNLLTQDCQWFETFCFVIFLRFTLKICSIYHSYNTMPLGEWEYATTSRPRLWENGNIILLQRFIIILLLRRMHKVLECFY